MAGTNSASSTRRQTLSDVLRRTALRHPDRLAIACGDVRWSYRRFHELCLRLASGLSRAGVKKGDRVAALARNSHAYAALRFALPELGAVFTPINFMLNAADVNFILKHSGATMLACDEGLASVARAAVEGTFVETLLGLPGEDGARAPKGMLQFDDLAAAAPDASLPGSASGDVAQIVYTSGTESRPKGVMLTHDAILSQYVSVMIDAEIAADDVALHAMPLFHCAQLDVFLGPSIYAGGVNIITARPIPENLFDLIAKYRVNSFFAPPTIWISMLRSPAFASADLSTLKKGYYGASIMPVEVLREMAARLPKVRLWNLYGQTEIAPLATLLGPDEQLTKPGSCGRAALNVETRVVDDDMNDVAPGEIGEIVHRSPHLMIGYYNDEERTREAFRGGWFHSGDLATIDAGGYITVVDRKKDMIKTGGENVASREVEEAIYRLPGVSEVAVIGLPHPIWIEAVTAVVVRKLGASISEVEVDVHCRKDLARFKQPKGVVFVDALPKNPSGKILKRDLREKFALHYVTAVAR